MAHFTHIKNKFGKLGYKDEKGNVVIDYKYDHGALFLGHIGVNEYESDYCPVAIGDRCGIIDINGNEVVPCIYDEAKYLFDDLFAVRINTESGYFYGVINDRQETIIPFQHKYISRKGNFICCFAKANSKRKYTHTLMDSSGLVYDYTYPHEESIFNASGKCIYIGKSENKCFDCLAVFKEDKLGVINTEGGIVLDFIYDYISSPCKNRYIVKRKIEVKDIYGVLDEQSNIIVEHKFKLIESEEGYFYHCYEYSECEDKQQELWLNAEGTPILKGEASVLSKDFIKAIANGKCAIYNKEGKRIANYIYDDVAVLGEYLVVSNDGKIGIIGCNGETIINCSYKKIECANISDKKYGGIFDPETISKYSTENVYESDSDNKKFHRNIIFLRYNKKISIPCPSGIDFGKTFILESDEHSNLFSLEEGILANSYYERIDTLTNLSFAVKSKGKWGVYRADIKEELIKCEYDKIKFEGNHTALLNKGELWGAKTLVLPSHILYPLFKCDIPIEFLEIEILDNMEHLFSVKRENTNYKDEKYTDYTIINTKGELAGKMDRFRESFTEHFKFYSHKRILAHLDDKLGFINLNGYVSIPFKYDELIERDDKKFDARIGNSWGVLSLSGQEIPAIKYSEQLPKEYNNTIVKDSISGCVGIIDSEGIESIPTIFEHIMLPDEEYNDKIIFFGHGGYDDGEPNFFSNIEHADWGCLNKKGNVIIEAKYDCFKFSNGFILAGRDGSMLGEGQHGSTYYEKEYGGIYDLYDFEGNLIIGGFTDFDYIESRGIFLFMFGGKWKSYCEQYDEWGNAIYYYSYRFEKGNSRWLALDKDLKTIIKANNGSQQQFSEGFIGTITPKEEGKKVNYWNMPLECFSIDKPRFYNNLMLCSDDDSKYVIRCTDGLASNTYDDIAVISDDVFFFLEIYDMGQGVGVSKLLNDHEVHLIEPLNDGTCILTQPIEGYVFGVYEYDRDKCKVSLYNIYDENFTPIVAIESIESETLMDYILRGKLFIELDAEFTDTHRIVMPDISIFDSSFREIINNKESNIHFAPFEKWYWYSDQHHLIKHEDCHSDYDGYDDDHDYMRDTWDAMTDGMYGDMPDGFDGDYDWLG